jgi:MinD-like ATPase involved in chromosome partitioning or flagellar assembly
MLTIVRSVAVLDRTGSLQHALRSQGLDVLDLRPAEFDLDPPDVDVLLVGEHELTSAGFRRMTRWRRLQPVGAVVVHVGDIEPHFGDLRAAGVQHVVRGRPTPAKMRNVLRRVDVSLAEVVVAAGRLAPGPFDHDLDVDLEVEESMDAYPAEPAGPSADHTSEGPLAKLITVASATGGCGKTFFATNAASIFTAAGARVLLVDLDLQFGEVAAALQVQHAYSLYDGLYGTSGERLPASAMREHLDDLVCHHPLGFDVLTAPRDPVLADFVGARDAMTMLDAVLPRYDVVIADTPPSLNDVVIAALDRSDLVAVLATLDVPSLRNLTSFLDVLRRLNMDDKRVRLVLNKAERDVGVTVQQANEAFGGRFEDVLPVDRAVSRSVNLGTTVTVHEPRAKVSRALVPSVTAMLGDLGLALTEPVPAAATRPTTTNVFGAFFRRLLSGGSA